MLIGLANNCNILHVHQAMEGHATKGKGGVGIAILSLLYSLIILVD